MIPESSDASEEEEISLVESSESEEQSETPVKKRK